MPTESEIINKITKYGLSLKRVEKQTPAICLAAVKKNGLALQYVKKQTPEICLAAVSAPINTFCQFYNAAIQCVKKQTPEICLASVKKDGLTLEYVKKQTPEICAAAISQNKKASRYVTIDVKINNDITNKVKSRLFKIVNSFLLATGKARCAFCEELIAKGDVDVSLDINSRCAPHFHVKCLKMVAELSEKKFSVTK